MLLATEITESPEKKTPVSLWTLWLSKFTEPVLSYRVSFQYSRL
jgi:hypothetical protein